jgi:hypothetical protein
MFIPALFVAFYLGAETPSITPAQCVAPPYAPLKVLRLPGVAATTSHPSDPLNDNYPPCLSDSVRHSRLPHHSAVPRYRLP